MVPKTIVIDFDGTICDFAYPSIGAIKPGVKEALSLFRWLGYHIVISSCRTCKHHPDVFSCQGKYGKEHIEMVDWLDANEVPYDEIDDGTKGKPVADFYIDDKGVRFDNNWSEIATFIRERS